MKKITILSLFALLSLNATGQTFPSPYCEITEYYDIEEITSVSFGSTVITNSNIEDILIDKTSTVVNVSPNESLTLTVAGNSYGYYDNEYVAFIDWNHNNILDDDGEVYYIGKIIDSDGFDGQTASIQIPIPAAAIAGNTRIRIIKTFTDEFFGVFLVNDPCNILAEDTDYEEISGSYGQALDFTLNIANLSTEAFDKASLSVYPNPSKDILNVNYKSVITDIKIYNLLGQEVYSSKINKSDFQLNISHLSSGAYVVKLTSPEGNHSFKLIKE